MELVNIVLGNGVGLLICQKCGHTFPKYNPPCRKSFLQKISLRADWIGFLCFGTIGDLHAADGAAGDPKDDGRYGKQAQYRAGVGGRLCWYKE